MAKKSSTSKTKKLPKMKSIAAKMQNKAGSIKNKLKKGAKQAKNKVTAVLNAVRINFNTTKTLQNKAKSFARGSYHLAKFCTQFVSKISLNNCFYYS